MPPRDFSIRIRDILRACEKILAHTKDMSFETFADDEWTQDAVIRNLTVIGEAARHIPKAVADRYSEVPWADIRDMRNIVVHEYFGVDLKVIWKTISEDIPDLYRRLVDR